MVLAGIAGLAAGFALWEAGHYVRVLESGSYEPLEGGLRVTPNFSKILTRWVGAEMVAQKTIQCHRTTLRDGTWFGVCLHTGAIAHERYLGASGETMGKIPWAEAVMKEAGGNYLLMHVRQNSVFSLTTKAQIA